MAMTLTTVDEHEMEVDEERVLANNVILPWEYNPHNVRPWVISNEYGYMGVVWASHEQDALDELVNNDLAAGILIDEADADEETARLGNAGEPACLDYCNMSVVRLDPVKDVKVLCKFAEARGATAANLNLI